MQYNTIFVWLFLYGAFRLGLDVGGLLVKLVFNQGKTK